MLIEKLNWRYATKVYDTSRGVSDDKLNAILEAVRLAPTSWGLQPFEVLVVKDPTIRQAIRAVGFDQPQITDASHLLAFAAWDNYTDARINAVVEEIGRQRGGDLQPIRDYYDRLKGMYLPRSAEENYQHAARQAYIAFGLGVTAAAFEEVDATPMEGFDAAQVDEILGLRAQGLRTVTLLALGYRAESGDWLSGLKKVRRPMADLVHAVE
jgi:nitroreductase/dihydropteridine reductase